MLIVKLGQKWRKFPEKNYKFRNPVTLCEYIEGIVNAVVERKFYLRRATQIHVYPLS